MTPLGCYPAHDPSKVQERTFFSGVLALVMSIVTMVRMTRNLPRQLMTDAAMSMYSSPKSQLPEPAISASEYMAMMKRLSDLEEKVVVLSKKMPALPPEKEEMLNNALSRVDCLEQELSATRKVLSMFLFIGGAMIISD